MSLSLLAPSRAQILVLFYKPVDNDHWINRLVAAVDPPYSHVEMAFPERYGDKLWYSIGSPHFASCACCIDVGVGSVSRGARPFSKASQSSTRSGRTSGTATSPSRSRCLQLYL